MLRAMRGCKAVFERNAGFIRQKVRNRESSRNPPRAVVRLCRLKSAFRHRNTGEGATSHRQSGGALSTFAGTGPRAPAPAE